MRRMVKQLGVLKNIGQMNLSLFTNSFEIIMVISMIYFNLTLIVLCMYQPCRGMTSIGRSVLEFLLSVGISILL